jgi:hypothetical protein
MDSGLIGFWITDSGGGTVLSKNPHKKYFL